MGTGSKLERPEPKDYFGAKAAAVAIGSLLFSIAGFVYGAYNDPATDGGREGAFAVALSFAVLFFRSNAGIKAYKTTLLMSEISHHIDDVTRLMKDEPETQQLEPEWVTKLNDNTSAVMALINGIGKTQMVQNFWLSTASVIGTVSWCLGDKAAMAIAIHILHRTFPKCLC